MLPPEFTVLYDGNCPICRREIAWLKWKNKQGKLGFQDISATEFKAELYGKTQAELMAEIHGIYADGKIIKGLEVFITTYQAVGLAWLFVPTRNPIIRKFLEILYGWFARHRLSLGRIFVGNPCRNNSCKAAKENTLSEKNPANCKNSK